MGILAAATPSAYWFITRGTGAVALVLLTISVALGIVTVRRDRFAGVPRFVFEAIHRSTSLLAMAFLVVHIATTLLDGFAPISLLDVFVPLHSAYRPIWLGLGAVAFDLLLAVTITSLVRARLGYRSWRAVHWLAYASWPVALVHGFGTGSDARTHWMLVLTVGCVAVMLTAIVARVTSGWPDHLATRLSALGAAAVVPIGLVLWLPSGPLGSGWARRAGTPAAVLAAAHSGSATQVSTGSAANSTGNAAPISIDAPFTGTVRQFQSGAGSAIVDLALRVDDTHLHTLRIRIEGEPTAGGGVQMTSSDASGGPAANPDQYRGRVTGLDGSNVRVVVSDAAGATLNLLAELQLGNGGRSATGTVQGGSAGSR